LSTKPLAAEPLTATAAETTRDETRARSVYRALSRAGYLAPSRLRARVAVGPVNESLG
jgi:hypothetical protein